MAFIFFLAFIVSFIGIILLLLFNKIKNHLPGSFPNDDFIKKIDHNQKKIVLFGDSNTHGIVSFNWVAELEKEYNTYQVINAGRNSDLTDTLLDRIDAVIACKPDHVNILIGTNDVNATMGPEMEKRYKTLKRIEENIKPSFEHFVENYRLIIEKLQSQTHAKISVMSLPLMGEDLNHEANQKADAYSEAIHDLAKKYQLVYIPLREAYKDYFLGQNVPKSKHDFSKTYQLLTISVIKHEILKRSWDKISKEHGFVLTPDNLHLNSKAGNILLQLLKKAI